MPEMKLNYAKGFIGVPVRQNYDPDQPRDPKGSPTGGRWTSGGGASQGAQEILHLLRTQGDGFSYSPISKKTPQSGFMCSVSDGPIFSPDMSDEESLKLIDQFLTEKADILGLEDSYAGGWLNSKDGQFYLDASRNFQDLDKTMVEAVSSHQIGVFDLQTFQTVWVGEWLKDHPDFDAPSGARDWYKKHPPG